MATPYLQMRLVHGRFTAPYTELFALAWQNALTLKVVGVMVCVGWLLLFLWQELFELIGIGFFKALFGRDPFAYLVTGLFAGLGVLVARPQHRAMQVARQVLFAIFTGLLPLAAFIAVIFRASLPFTGLAPLERAASTASTLGALVAALVLLLNAVVQTGRAPPYPRPLRWLIDAAIVALPLFAAIALHAVLVRIGEAGAGWAARGSATHFQPSKAELEAVQRGRIRALPPVFDDLVSATRRRPARGSSPWTPPLSALTHRRGTLIRPPERKGAGPPAPSDPSIRTVRRLKSR